MNSKDKAELRRFEKYWKKRGRRDMFTWIHRYIRLHGELLMDSVYQRIYDYHRATLVAYLKKDEDTEKFSDEKLGELVDVLADIFNKNHPEYVDKYKPVVDMLYENFKKNPDILKDIRV